MLSFETLIEAHVLRALRTDHGVSVKDVRRAPKYAEEALGVERLLLRPELCTEGGEHFVDRYGAPINLSASSQLAIRKLLEQHLERVVWDEPQAPVRLYPFLASEGTRPDRPIVIDPRGAFGRPIVVRRGISTRAIAERSDAGETVAELAADYDLRTEEIEEAVLYERAA